eukprot:CAMPEP_0119335880 /NCGR_PEP_ID=MMETSP1333-20130426/90584_1 /TAXON_ID=418940 /ORGANISM="Scyphosphaera apsteinii, Strain RCC1455" /LENGTH=92 /DNA_ID=CAMNT_0007346549 /DNA_START=306 /DNA_END=582 /DNA_ORIENTATION=-
MPHPLCPGTVASSRFVPGWKNWLLKRLQEQQWKAHRKRKRKENDERSRIWVVAQPAASDEQSSCKIIIKRQLPQTCIGKSALEAAQQTAPEE